MSDELNLPPIEDSLGAAEPAPPAPPEPPAAPPAEDLFEVKIDGKPFRVPREEVIAGYQRQQDYTRKTMALAERAREIERIQQEHASLRAEREQLKQFLSDRAAVQEYLKQLQGFDTPDSPVTAGQMQQLVDRQLAMREQALERRFANMATELEVRQTATRYAAEIDSTISGALEQFPELKSVRRIERILREEVAERQPSNLDEAKALFLQVAKEQAEGLRNFAQAEKKRAAANEAQLRKGIEPPGGTGVQPVPQKFKLGSDELRKAFEQSLVEGGQA